MYSHNCMVMNKLGFLETVSLDCFKDVQHAQSLQDVVTNGYSTLVRLRGAGLHMENGRMSQQYRDTVSWIAFALEGLRDLVR